MLVFSSADVKRRFEEESAATGTFNSPRIRFEKEIGAFFRQAGGPTSKTYKFG